MKYRGSDNEKEILPNKPGLNSKQEIEIEEYYGFLRAALVYEAELKNINTFNWKLIASIHKTALSHLYEFAGRLRTVNISKGGFPFPAAKYLDRAVKNFEKDFLLLLPKAIESNDELIKVVAPIHAELLYIHPFREGNGRTARLFANIMSLKYGFNRFSFDYLKPNKMEEYIAAVQSAADKNYQPMVNLFKSLP